MGSGDSLSRIAVRGVTPTRLPSGGQGVQVSKPLKPGQPAPRSGEYQIIGPRGGQTNVERTVVRGEPLPPTPSKGSGYLLSRPAKNGAGRGK
jgi:hypothetical protein